MLGYLQGLFARFFAYIYSACSRKQPDESEETTPLDPREPIIEDYIKDKELKELNEIFNFVKKRKEYPYKYKCTLR